MPVGDTTSVPLTTAWTKLSTVVPALANGDRVRVQHGGPAGARVLHGEFAAAPAAGAGGFVLEAFDDIFYLVAAARALYVRSDHGSAVVVVSDAD